MKSFPQQLIQKLEERNAQHKLRELPGQKNAVDFASNDYLGFSSSETIFRKTQQLLYQRKIKQNGATGSRLLSGNHALYEEAEHHIAAFHNTARALIFNSGYNANIGLLSSMLQRGSIILYDQYSHASIRDGIYMSRAKAYKYKHNDLDDLERLLQRVVSYEVVYIITESVFSMDGDTPDLIRLSALAEYYGALLIVDEAHAIGVHGKHGCGLVQHLGIEEKVFARIVTFGKAMGCHGAAILGSKTLISYLINFSRSFIYTTGLSPHTVGTILTAYQCLEKEHIMLQKLTENISFFNACIKTSNLQHLFIESSSAIHCCVVPGNRTVVALARQLCNQGFDVSAVRSPTVPEGRERLRFCLHSYNTQETVKDVLNALSTFVS